VIEFRDVHKHFGPLHVLRGINLTVRERDVVVIIGPSGSGKSTMIRTINKLEPIDSGELVVDGQRVHDPSVDVNKLRRDVGMVFQSFNLFPHLTAAENVMLAPRKVRGMSRTDARTKAMALLEKVGIPEKADEHLRKRRRGVLHPRGWPRVTAVPSAGGRRGMSREAPEEEGAREGGKTDERRSENRDPSEGKKHGDGFAAGESSGRLAGYRIDAGSGNLDRIATYAVGKMPWWVTSLRLPGK